MFTADLKSFAAEYSDLLLEFHQGIEKEGLRALENASASHRPHHPSLGHKLTHPYITTDYAENLLEFVTPVFTGNQELLDFIAMIQSFALKVMDEDEFIWPSSMPCKMPEDELIPIADFGSSNTGRLKSLYRKGLGHRYGRSMQSIAGMHFNYSLSRELISKINARFGEGIGLKDFTDQFYFKMIRNFRRHSWLLTYLFGASPAVDESFLRGKKHTLEPLGPNTFGREYATSLRMGGLGYTSVAQKDISICYNKIDTYVGTLESARKRSYPPYEKIGVKVDGEFRQLNANLLQIDNEFYSTLRPKRTARSGESALQALHRHGVEYIEVRLLDLNPFALEGISEEEVRFLQLFLTYCSLDESPYISKEECDEIDRNFDTVVNDGRNPKALLIKKGKSLKVKEAGEDLLAKMQNFIETDANLKTYYQEAIDAQLEKLQEPSKTYSALVLEPISQGASFLDSTKELGLRHKKELLNRELEPQKMSSLKAMAEASFVQEREMVSADKEEFEKFLEDYFSKIEINEYP